MSQLPSMSVTSEELDLSTNLMSTMLFTFLMGIYTIVYFGTLYAYLTRKASQRYLVVATVTTIYLINVVELAIQWWLTEWQFIKNGKTRDTIFIADFSYPRWFHLINTFNSSSVFVLADGLLIWRCFHLWRPLSLRVMALPILLWVAEIGLILLTLIDSSELQAILKFQQRIRVADLQSALTFLSFVTTVMTTSLIVYRIYSVSKQNGSSIRRIKHILDIVVQSSFFYSLASLVPAISYVLDTNPTAAINTSIIALNSYGNATTFVAPGLASTVMVARVALLAPDTTGPSVTPYLSGLRFQGHSTAPTDIRTQARMASIVVEQADSSPV